MQPYEKLGAFYLGQPVTPDGAGAEPLLLESQRLVTHALCLGMTGSGKTGLCLTLLEEAAIDGVPVLAIDPKGDLGNLLLTFPALAAEDFEPWVDPDEAARRNLSTHALAAEKAELAQKGLADTAQDGERIARLKAAADFAIYTPGTKAGLSLSILRSLELPSQAVRDDEELLRERVSAVVSGLLSLVGEDGDPLTSRAHILIAKLLLDAFGRGESLSLASLLRAVKAPPFSEVGVLDLETFFPEKERMELVRTLNNLLASPGFSGFVEGEPLDVQSLLYTREGKPRVAIVSIAHLDDKQRMFFVTLLLNEVLAWLRSQSGTSSLRALLYMDEVFGYFPPVAEPPSKRPMLTLLKQARAFGLGVVLATQNPVDLDYKGLGNIGTWFIGRLQTARDRERVLDGLGAAAQASGATLDRAGLDAQLAGLAPRTFLLHSARGGQPLTFKTRFALSFLRGPLTRAEIKRLMDARRSSVPLPVATPKFPTATSTAGAEPVLPSGIAVYYAEGPADAERYEPHAFVLVRAAPADGRARTALVHAPITDGVVPVRFEDGSVEDCDPERLARAARAGVGHAPLPEAALAPKRYAAYAKDGLAHAQSALALVSYTSRALKLKSDPGEDEAQFRVRVVQAARERRDAAVEALRAKSAHKLERLRDKEAELAARMAREQAEANQKKLSSALDVGGALLGAFFGRGLNQSTITKASRAAESVARAGKEHGDVTRVSEAIAELQKERAELEAELRAAIEALPQPEGNEVFEQKLTKLKKTELTAVLSGLLFVPR